MSGFASNIILSGKVFAPPESQDTQPEAAGRVGRILGVIAAVIIPFAAPAIWGAIAGSTAIGASISSGLTGIFGSSVANIIGSAAVGGLMNAGVAYASGARGGDVWRAAGMGALQGGLGGLRGVGSAASAAKPGLNAVGGTGPVNLTPGGASAAAGSAGVTPITGAGTYASGAVAGGTMSPSLVGGIRQAFGNAISNIDLNRVGAAIINAAVNGQSMGRLDALVAQQRTELEALRQQDQAQYALRINAAQQILAEADRQDPSWLARTRMADVAGVEANQFRQTMRNIATTQGGSLDQGQRKAYERSASLHTARSKALAWGQGWGEGVRNQSALRAQGAGLLTSPSTAFYDRETELLAGQQRARDEAARSTAGGFIDAFGGGGNHTPTTSPAPADQDDEDQDAYTVGLRWGRD